MEDQVKEPHVDEVAVLRRRIAELERILEISRELTSALTSEHLPGIHRPSSEKSNKGVSPLCQWGG